MLKRRGENEAEGRKMLEKGEGGLEEKEEGGKEDEGRMMLKKEGGRLRRERREILKN